jgi:hypothetical protein
VGPALIHQNTLCKKIWYGLLSLLDHQTQLQLQEGEVESPWIFYEDQIQGHLDQPVQIPLVGHPESNDERAYHRDREMAVWCGSCHHNHFHLQSKPPVAEVMGEVGAADFVTRIPVAQVLDLLAMSSIQVETFVEFPASFLPHGLPVDQETWPVVEGLIPEGLVHGHWWMHQGNYCCFAMPQYYSPCTILCYPLAKDQQKGRDRVLGVGLMAVHQVGLFFE